jgi:lipoprotein-anchoring transpeptidase ErfK/SrfK
VSARPGRHRDTGPRLGRAIAGVLAAGITGVAVMGGVGALPSLASRQPDPAAAGAETVGRLAASETSDGPAGTVGSALGNGSQRDATVAEPSPGATAEEALSVDDAPADDETALPADSGKGRRIVFSESRQRVWLVSGKQRVKRTYLVSGSVYDNLDPGTYEVYSRSEQAWGIDDSGTMRYFVRFTQGQRAAIGFHDIPIADGRLVQTAAQLGTPQSHGCIRQERADAQALWRFAPIGTPVVVTP